jgi:hypothetical protein
MKVIKKGDIFSYTEGKPASGRLPPMKIHVTASPLDY